MNIRGAGVPCVVSGLLPGPTGPTGAGGAIGYYGSFYDKTDQPLVSTTASQVVSLGMTSINNGVSIAGGNRVLFDHEGVYSVTFSILWTNTGNDVEQVNVWLKLNGNDIADSSTRFDVLQKKNASTPGHAVGTVNFVLDINPADYIQVYWSGTSTNLKIEHFGTGSSPTHPEVPGIIITAVQTMYSVSGGGGSSFIWEGAWSSGTTYAVNDVVEYNGSSYIAIQAGTNQQPDTATTYWELMAAKGATGSTGATGATGPQGPQGDPGAGVATGGTTGQYLRKSSATNYDTAWTTFALVNADIDVSANIDWSKINKTGSSLADLATRTTANLTDFPSQTGNSGKYLTTNGLGTLSWGSVSGASQIEACIVAGGGAGGGGPTAGGTGGAGGGGGGVIEARIAVDVNQAFTVTIGGGGTGSAGADGGTGTNTSFGSLTASGGGGGRHGNNTFTYGLDGGCGGGANPSSQKYGGRGTAGQGYGGGPAIYGSGGTGYSAGGGGGAGGPAVAIDGGDGRLINWSSGSESYGGGGGGGALSSTSVGRGGRGGGGDGAANAAGNAGSTNTGGGGGGGETFGANVAGGNGGSGLVIVRYLGATKATGGTITSVNGYTIHTFTGNGTFTWTG